MSTKNGKNGKNGNGKLHAVPAAAALVTETHPAVPPPDGPLVKCSEAESKHLQHLENNLQQTKVALADCDMQIAALELRRQQFRSAVQAQGAAIVEAIRGIAKQHGINPDDPTPKVSWNFNLAAREFTRVGESSENVN